MRPVIMLISGISDLLSINRADNAVTAMEIDETSAASHSTTPEIE